MFRISAAHYLLIGFHCAHACSFNQIEFWTLRAHEPSRARLCITPQAIRIQLQYYPAQNCGSLSTPLME